MVNNAMRDMMLDNFVAREVLYGNQFIVDEEGFHLLA